MRRYELMLLLRPDLDDEKLQGAVEKVTRAIVNGGGSLSKVSPWGKRRLAYDIQRFREASYFLIHFDIEPSAIREIERGMLISEEILRHLVTVIEERPAGEQPAEALNPDAAADAAAQEEGSTEVGGADEPSPAKTRDRSATAADEEAQRGEPAAEPTPVQAATASSQSDGQDREETSE
jgi:small subunit ribosomal protein S6